MTTARGHEPLAEPVNYLVTNGNACWLEGDVIMCAPLDTLSRPQWADTGAADPRAFHDNDDYARLAQALEIAAGIEVG